MDILLDSIREHWRKAVLALLLLAGAYMLFLYHIHGLAPLYTRPEVITQQTTQSLHLIWNNPENAPYKLILWFGHKLGHHAILDARIVSGVVGIIAAGLFFYIVRSWFCLRIAIFATILFVTSSSFLHPARYGAPYILQMGVLILFASLLFYQTKRRGMQGWARIATRYVLAAMLLLMLYVPGMLWFIVLGVVLMPRALYRVIRSQSYLHLSLLSLLALFMLAPLVWIGIHNYTFDSMMLGFPSPLPSFSSVGHNFVSLLSQLGFHSTAAPDLTLIGAPLLNVIDISLVALGLATQLRRPHLKPNYYLLSALPLALVLASLGGLVTYVVLAPLIYLLIAGGLYFLFDQWFQVFPRNPVAKVFGYSLISVLIVFSVLYHVRAYYVAWPNASSTRATYNLPHPK